MIYKLWFQLISVISEFGVKQ